jgi:hypothetical protein
MAVFALMLEEKRKDFLQVGKCQVLGIEADCTANLTIGGQRIGLRLAKSHHCRALVEAANKNANQSTELEAVRPHHQGHRLLTFNCFIELCLRDTMSAH